jgi:nitrogen fixation protein FixH
VAAVKKPFALGAMTFVFSAVLAAGSWSGILMDTTCKASKNPEAHTRKCALHCADGGFGLVTTDGTFVKFDKAGDEKALALLRSSKKDDNLKATVTGTLEGTTLKVETVTLD